MGGDVFATSTGEGYRPTKTNETNIPDKVQRYACVQFDQYDLTVLFLLFIVVLFSLQTQYLPSNSIYLI